jgi:hypothetical protein
MDGGTFLFFEEDRTMRTNSGDGKAKNNNHDPTIRDHLGGQGPAQTSVLDHEEDQPSKSPSDNRQSRK